MNDVQINDLFGLEPIEDAFRKFMRPWRMEFADSRTPNIRLDVNENDKDFIIRAEIPGVRKEDVDVRIDGSQVTISAEVKKESEEKSGERVLRSERLYGYASRSFTLASSIDEGRSSAKYKDGILELILPKSATTSAKRLAITG